MRPKKVKNNFARIKRVSRQDKTRCKIFSNPADQIVFLKNGPTPASFSFFSSKNFTEKTVYLLQGDLNTIVGVEGEHAGYLTTTTAQG